MTNSSHADFAGPFDVSEVASTMGYLSFGTILMPTIEGVSVRVEVDENSKQVVAVSFEHQGSTLQVSAFASSKSESLWDEIYEQLIQTIRANGGQVTETIGGLGKQLDTVLGAADGSRAIRFIGFDGPRWFLRGAISGNAITDVNAALNMEDIFRALVIDRGSSPLPPREPLPLKVPDGNFVPPTFDL